MAEPIEIPTETARAAEAFAQYVAMGPGRSLRGLGAVLAEQGVYKTSASAFRVLKDWSVKYRWQERLAAAITEKTERMLAHAAEIDAKSFLRTSELIAERLAWTDAGHIDVVLKARESVRRPAPKGSANIDVDLQVTVSLRALAERVAQEEGLDPEEVVAWADRYVREGV
jgi:hypothetical protein